MPLAPSPLQQRLAAVRHSLPPEVRLVAVSKFQPLAALREAYAAGQRIFGESRVQELQEKHTALPPDVEWHFIGHLQVNKVKYIAPYVALIHAVDSWKLLVEIDRRAAQCARRIDCLLQLHVAQEESKFGFSPDACCHLLDQGEWRQLEHVRICGLMCMASNTDDESRIRREFHTARTLFEQLRARHFANDEAFRECSWGMSDDYPLALEAGSTLVRVGSKIFGSRA